jgi:hypothetical protein
VWPDAATAATGEVTSDTVHNSGSHSRRRRLGVAVAVIALMAGGAAVAVVAPSTGLPRVWLDPATDRDIQADWELAVFSRTEHRLVASSAGLCSYRSATARHRGGADLFGLRVMF